MRKIGLILFSVLTLAQLSHADINVTEGSGKVVKTTTSGGKEIQWVQFDVSSNAVTNAGTFPVQATLSGTPTVQVIGSTVGITDAGGSITVDNGGTFAVQAAQSGAYTVTNSTVGAILFVNGSSVSSTNPLPVQDTGTVTVTGTIATTQSGTWTVQPGNTQNTTPWQIISTNTVVVASTGTTKVRTSIWSGQTLTASAANIVSSTVTLTTGYGAQLSIRLTNGATGPTVAAQVQITVANDSGMTLPVSFGGALVGLTSNSGVQSWSIQLPIGAAAVSLTAGSNTGQNVTVDADISQVTKWY